MKNIIIAYFPAYHSGVKEFLMKHIKDHTHVILLDRESLETIDELEHLNRDIRAVAAEDMKRLIRSSHLCGEISVEGPSSSSERIKSLCDGENVIVADDEVSRAFLTLMDIDESSVTFDNSIFLRWGKNTVPREVEITPDIIIDEDDLPKELMRLAEQKGAKSTDWWRRVGAVIMKDGNVIFSECNHHLLSQHAQNIEGDARSNFKPGERIELCQFIHAEASIIAQAARSGVALDGASIFVTDFPCPPCAYQIAEAGIKKIYFRRGYSLMNTAKEILQDKRYNIKLILVK
ncbi:MAG: deaminase [Candidatus Nomurabacteria bacterium]|nr:deaminase [Candidatus Nomurabacteria bacterium]